MKQTVMQDLATQRVVGAVVAKSFICRGCLNPVTSAVRTSVDIGASAKLELVAVSYTHLTLPTIYSV